MSVTVKSITIPEEAALLTERQTRGVLQVSRGTLLKLAEARLLLPVRIPGVRAVRYRRADVEACLANLTSGR
jgi:hypothetical protein